MGEIEQTDAKAGRRNSTADQGALDEAHAAIVRAGATCGSKDEMPYAKANDLAAADEALPVFASIKAAGDWELEIKVAYGGPNVNHAGKASDSHGEYFAPDTDFDVEHFPTPPVAYYHGFDESGKPMGTPDFLGRTTRRESKVDGHYLYVPLKKNNQRAAKVWQAALEGRAVASPGTISYLRRVDRDGKCRYWPIAEISVWDYDGRRKPANMYSVATPVMKALYEEAGIDLPSIAIEQTSETQSLQATATGAETQSATATANVTAAKTDTIPTKDKRKTMDEQEIQRLIAESVANALKADADARAAAEQKAKDDEARINQLVEERVATIKAEAAKARRLPDNSPVRSVSGGAPYVAQFADTRKYDHLDVADLAVMAGALDACKRRDGQHSGVSDSALKALAIRIAEDKSEYGDEARRDLKAAGIDPQDAVNAAKANELNYSTQSGFGDEWVGVEYSRRLWPAIRSGSRIVSRVPSIEVPQGMESITIPLEGADPTWYKVGQATDNNGTTLRPDATVTASKLATSNKSLTVAKMGARVIYAEEMNEDSLIMWAPQLRQQLEVSGSENLEHALIDGDTDTSATTNINHIGGTPGSTDLYLLFNGFRKSPLVTTTANSRSASGSLADTDFLNTIKLMGTAGLNAADRNKVSFLIDPNVHWKALELASVKTKDVFTGATLESGELRGIFGYEVLISYFMHFKSSVRKANTSGKVDQTTTSNNTTGAILAVRWDQWLLGYKRRMQIKLQELIDSDTTQIVALARVGLAQRDAEASAISYNVGI